MHDTWTRWERQRQAGILCKLWEERVRRSKARRTNFYLGWFGFYSRFCLLTITRSWRLLSNNHLKHFSLWNPYRNTWMDRQKRKESCNEKTDKQTDRLARNILNILSRSDEREKRKSREEREVMLLTSWSWSKWVSAAVLRNAGLNNTFTGNTTVRREVGKFEQQWHQLTISPVLNLFHFTIIHLSKTTYKMRIITANVVNPRKK